MGYETKLVIGEEGFTSDEIKRGELVIEDGEAYRQYIKDEYDNFVRTGKKETYFSVIATIDLCKCGYDSAISEIDFKNNDESHFWYYYDGNEKTVNDCYGDKSKPVSIGEVVKALEKDVKNSDYRRFKWALDMLKSMESSDPSLKVMFYGH